MSTPPPQPPKQNNAEALLQEILQTQQQQLQVSKKLLNTERFRVIGNWVKLIILVVLFYYSLVFTKDLVQNFSTNMPSLMESALGGSANLELEGAEGLTEQLQSSQQLLQELLGQ